MQSRHYDDLLAVAATWHQLPSALARRYMPELARNHHIAPADWYMFDVAATARWVALQQEAHEAHDRAQPAHPATGTSTPMPAVTAATARGPVVRERGDDLAIRGTEIPPWDARYTGKRQP